MVYYCKKIKTKKSFLLTVFFLATYFTKNLYGIPDIVQIGVCNNLPGIVVCGAKLLLPHTAHSFLGSTRIADFIHHGPEIVPQLIMIGSNTYINFMLLREKRNLPDLNKHSEAKDRTKVKNFTGSIVFAGLGEVVILYLFQCSVLWYQERLDYKAASIAGINTLIHILPSYLFI